MPVIRSENGSWPEVEVTEYKDEPGTWIGVTRRVVAQPREAKFETRYFDLAPGGYTSFERHRHEHVVVVASGSGTVRLGDRVETIGPGDLVHVPPDEPHQFRTETGMAIFCTVDRERDRPVLLRTDGSSRASQESS